VEGATGMSNDKINLLIVDDEEQFLRSISKSLSVRDFNVVAVNRGEKAIEAARKTPIDIALVDLKMPGIDGEETLKQLKAEHRWMEVIILTGHGTIDSAVECTKSAIRPWNAPKAARIRICRSPAASIICSKHLKVPTKRRS